MADFNKIGLLTIKENRFLMCRKNHFTSRLILPGGRMEAGEAALECLERELKEELGDGVTAIHLSLVGTYTDFAHADDPSIIKTLEMQVYQGELLGEASPHAEIVELVWFGKDSDPKHLTPIMSNKILPDLLKRGILKW